LKRRLVNARGAIALSVLVVAAAIAIGACGLRGIARADDSPAAAPRASADKTDPRDKLARKVAKIIPGKTSKAQVVSALGQPWRTVHYNDMDEPEAEIWEYRGRDANGPYRVHLEFDEHQTVKIVGKIPDTPQAGGTPVRAVP
jgi:hypothetical protein